MTRFKTDYLNTSRPIKKPAINNLRKEKLKKLGLRSNIIGKFADRLYDSSKYISKDGGARTLLFDSKYFAQDIEIFNFNQQDGTYKARIGDKVVFISKEGSLELRESGKKLLFGKDELDVDLYTEIKQWVSDNPDELKKPISFVQDKPAGLKIRQVSSEEIIETKIVQPVSQVKIVTKTVKKEGFWNKICNSVSKFFDNIISISTKAVTQFDLNPFDGDFNFFEMIKFNHIDVQTGQKTSFGTNIYKYPFGFIGNFLPGVYFMDGEGENGESDYLKFSWWGNDINFRPESKHKSLVAKSDGITANGGVEFDTVFGSVEI